MIGMGTPSNITVYIIVSIKMTVYENQFHVHFVDLLVDNYFTY